ncbi:hypothetical protein TcG_00101 [Trypanosoma cruzi]|nr:hypothetical protein TcG_00101 [Trypanosoma cruzi]
MEAPVEQNSLDTLRLRLRNPQPRAANTHAQVPEKRRCANRKAEETAVRFEQTKVNEKEKTARAMIGRVSHTPEERPLLEVFFPQRQDHPVPSSGPTTPARSFIGFCWGREPPKNVIKNSPYTAKKLRQRVFFLSFLNPVLWRRA